jgi:cold shock CspA family protein
LRHIRGFCFIRPDDPSQTDVFCHATALAGGDTFADLAVGDRVTYELTASRNKPGTLQATNVRILA